MARRRAGIVATAALASIAAACAAGASDRRPPEGFDPGIGVYLPHDPRDRSPEWDFYSSDPVSGLTDQLRVAWDRLSDGESVEAFVDLDFFPTAITGEGPERLFLAGLRAGETVLVERTFELGDALRVGVERTLLATSRLTTVTSLRHRPVAGSPGRLLLLDAPQATFWVLDLDSASLTLLADGSSHPGLVGKRSFFDAQEDGSPDVHCLFFEHFPYETAIGATDRIERLVDVGGDFTIDRSESMTGADYVR